jgi:IS30 family transposase
MITRYNGSKFANLSKIKADSDTKVYFTRPYSSFEKGTNEHHNGLLGCFVLKRKRITDYSIAFIEE